MHPPPRFWERARYLFTYLYRWGQKRGRETRGLGVCVHGIASVWGVVGRSLRLLPAACCLNEVCIALAHARLCLSCHWMMAGGESWMNLGQLRF